MHFKISIRIWFNETKGRRKVDKKFQANWNNSNNESRKEFLDTYLYFFEYEGIKEFEKEQGLRGICQNMKKKKFQEIFLFLLL